MEIFNFATIIKFQYEVNRKITLSISSFSEEMIEWNVSSDLGALLNNQSPLSMGTEFIVNVRLWDGINVDKLGFYYVYSMLVNSSMANKIIFDWTFLGNEPIIKETLSNQTYTFDTDAVTRFRYYAFVPYLTFENLTFKLVQGYPRTIGTIFQIETILPYNNNTLDFISFTFETWIRVFDWESDSGTIFNYPNWLSLEKNVDN